MSFRKRFTPLPSRTPNTSTSSTPSTDAPPPSQSPTITQHTSTLPRGVRSSPLSGLPTISTGNSTLDSLLGGHIGLSLGTSLLISENGTTDYAGALLRLYAAEGVMQGHQVHVVGVMNGEAWGKELPGLAAAPREGGGGREDTGKREMGELGEVGMGVNSERMKIAWRYEGLPRGRERVTLPDRTSFVPSSAPLSASTSPQPSPTTSPPSLPIPPFPHAFDLTKRLTLPPSSLPIIYHPTLDPTSSTTTTTRIPTPTLNPIITALTTSLSDSFPSTIHRIVIPSLLSPLAYHPSYSDPETLIPFIHNLRILLHTYPRRLSILLSLPIDLYPRTTGLVRWLEILVDGSIELTPFPHAPNVSDPAAAPVATSASNSKPAGSAGRLGGEDGGPPQGLLRVHKVPVNSERGESAGEGEWAFWMSRRKFVVKAWSLPPVEGEEGEKGREGVGYEF